MNQKISTPWGISDYAKEYAPGLVFYGTPGHGGFKVSAERWKEIKAKFPKFEPFACENWLEEDCDWAAACLVWPELFPAEQLEIAKRTAKHSCTGLTA